MLEARTVTSGATGRNGGHIKDAPFHVYAELKDRFGKHAAQKIVRFRLSHLDTLIRIAGECGHDSLGQCEMRRVQGIHAIVDPGMWEEAKAKLENFLSDMPDQREQWSIHAGEDLEKLRLSHVAGAIAGPAGALSPYNLVTSILDTLREQHPGTFSIETFTPVRSIESNSSGYQVRLDRGTINCLFVVHCTNGYVGHLLPSLRSAIVPVRGQMTAQSPGANFTNEGVRHSWTFVHRRGYDYMTQSGETGSIFLGGGLLNGANDGLDDFGNSDDSRESQLSILHLGGLLPAMFGSRHWGAGGDDRMKASWTGIMGWSADGLPWVGQIPPAIAGREVAPGHGGEWLAGGFSGEGMVSAWRSAEAVVAMMLKEEDISGWFPEQFLVSEERLSQADPNTLLGLCM